MSRFCIQSLTNTILNPSERRVDKGKAVRQPASRSADYRPRPPKGGDDGDALSPQQRSNIGRTAKELATDKRYSLPANAFSLLSGRNRDLVVDRRNASAHHAGIGRLADALLFGLSLELTPADVRLLEATVALMSLQADYAFGQEDFKPLGDAAFAEDETSDLVQFRIDLARTLALTPSLSRTLDLTKILARLPDTLRMTSAGLAVFLPKADLLLKKPSTKSRPSTSSLLSTSASAIAHEHVIPTTPKFVAKLGLRRATILASLQSAGILREDLLLFDAVTLPVILDALSLSVIDRAMLHIAIVQCSGNSSCNWAPTVISAILRA